MENLPPTSIFNPDKDEFYMLEAIKLAVRADEEGDVPIGACIVYNDRVIARAWNQRELLQDPTAHAEMIALTQASEFVGSWRLGGCTMYVTLEPCAMCAGALVLSRIDRLVYGCRDPKTGAAGSLYNIVQDERLNHRVEVTEGVLGQPCSMMMSDFFRRRREEKSREDKISRLQK